MSAGVCLAPSLANSSSSLCLGLSPPLHAHLSVPVSQQWHRAMPLLAFMQPEALLLVVFSISLWLLGVISGLLLPLVLQRVSILWNSSAAADAASISGDSAVLAPGLQSRPLSDVDPDEILDDELLLSSGNSALHHQVLASGAVLTPHWHISIDDLEYFKSVVEPVKGRLLTGDLGPGWNFIMEKERPGHMRYASYWRPTANGKTDYLSITIVNGTTAQEMHEFNLEDTSRVGWDPMLKAAWLLQSGKDVEHTAEQLVVYLRSFPMGFVSDRLYAGISRREFSEPSDPGCFWTVSKVVHTPATAAWAALNYPGVTMTDDYYSAWECRTILSPWADTAASPDAEPQPACAIILLHHDDLKVPEYLARTAIKLGMWKFVQGMVGYADKWLRERRTRQPDPFQPDPQAAGRQPAPPLSPDVAAAAAAVAHRHTPLADDMLTPDAGIAAPGAAGGGVELPGMPLVRASRSLSNSPHSSWAGFKGQQQQQEQHPQPSATPRVLYTIPTAPGPLNLMGQEEGPGNSSGQLLSGRGQLRRGHSLEWEPRVQSSSNNSSVVGDNGNASAAAADAGGGSNTAGQQDSPWQRFMQAVGSATRRPMEWGGAAGGAVGGAAVQLAHAPGAGWNWMHDRFRGQQGQGGDGVGEGGLGSSGRVAKPGGARFLAPAGPEDQGVTDVAAAATAAAATAQQQGAVIESRASSLHSGLTADFGRISSSLGRRGSTVAQRLRRLFVAAAVAAAVGAGVAAHSRRQDRSAQQQGESEPSEQVIVERKQERRQQRMGVKVGL